MSGKVIPGRVGVAIVAWNNKDILAECLDSVKNQTYGYVDTIVLDNASTDQTARFVKEKFEWVKLIESERNTGFAGGNNLIIQKFMKDSSVKYIVLLNSDARLEPTWIEELVSFAEKSTKVAFLQGLTLDYYNHDVVDSTHIYINRRGQAIQYGHRALASGVGKEAKKIFGANAAACMLTRDFLVAQPFKYLFDEDFFMYLEDVDIAARSVILGWNNYFVPTATAYHMGSASSGKNPGFSVYMVNRNRWPLLFKNLPLTVILMLLPGMIVGDAQELYRIGRAGNYFVMRKFIIGRIKGFFTTLKYYRRRKLILRSRAISSKDLWQLMLNGTIN